MLRAQIKSSVNITSALLLMLVSSLAFSVPFESGPGTTEYEEGVNYSRLPTPVATVKKDKIEVREFFSYACPHCFQFESVLHPWKVNLPEDVVLERTPAIFRPDWEPLARAYFVSEALGVTDKTHHKIFEAIHVKKQNMSSQTALSELFAANGVSATQFDKAYRSFGVGTQVKQATAMLRLAQVTGVPNMLVNGKYLVSSQKNAGFEGMLKVVDYLVEKERAAMAKEKAAE